jgi:phosphoglycerate dehydrogenase-like enzyme
MPFIVVEEDRVLRLIQVILDPQTTVERLSAFTDFNSTDQADFSGWLARIREELTTLFPATVQLVNSQEELQKYLPQADVVIIESLGIGETELKLGEKLKVIYKFGTLADNINDAACKQWDIPVFTLRRRTNIAMAEHTMLLILALAKRMPTITKRLTDKQMAVAGSPFRPYDTRHTAGANYARIPELRTLYDCTLGLLGFGEIGREVARIANAFGLTVFYYKKNRLSQIEEAELKVTYCEFDELFKKSDFLSVHVPFSDKTKDLVGQTQLNLMKPGSYLINTSRAHIVNHDALLESLNSGKLAGAAADVHYKEPVEESEQLLELEQFIMTPHLGGGSRMNGLKDAEVMLLNINKYLSK